MSARVTGADEKNRSGLSGRTRQKPSVRLRRIRDRNLVRLDRLSEKLLLPEGSVLVHIGPYKTGSTAIQMSLHKHREDLRRLGVLYPGSHHRQHRPGMALLGRRHLGLDPVEPREWEDLAEEVRGSDASRVCLSTEDLASADMSHIKKLVDDLGSDRVHIAMVMRRLDKLLPSAWQERVKSSKEYRTYDQWLREVLAEERSGAAAKTFWHNHGAEALLDRWRQVLPSNRLTMIVADEADRGLMARTMERMLGLPENLLTPGDHSNTSLSYEKVELCRRANVAFDEHGWSDAHRRTLIYRGMIRGLRGAPSSDTDVPIPSLPRWAADRVATLSELRTKAVAASRTRVVGDPQNLRFVPAEHEDEIGDLPQFVGIETAAAAVESVVDAALRAERRSRRSRRKSAPAPAPARELLLADASGRQLLREALRRFGGRLRP